MQNTMTIEAYGINQIDEPLYFKNSLEAPETAMLKEVQEDLRHPEEQARKKKLYEEFEKERLQKKLEHITVKLNAFEKSKVVDCIE